MRQPFLFDDLNDEIDTFTGKVQQLSSGAIPPGQTSPTQRDTQAATVDVQQEDSEGTHEDEGEGEDSRQDTTGSQVPFGVKRTKEARQEASGIELVELYHKQQGQCALTGLPLTTEDMACDHIEPRESGGADTVDNLQWIHQDVNNMKGTLDQGRFIKLCKLIASAGNPVDDREW